LGSAERGAKLLGKKEGFQAMLDQAYAAMNTGAAPSSHSGAFPLALIVLYS